MVTTARVLGLDLSLRGTGLALVPGDWGLDWSRVRVDRFGIPLEKTASVDEQLERLSRICAHVLRFACQHKATHVVVEDYAFSKQSSRAHALGELGGNVKLSLRHAGLPVCVVKPNSARALLGKAPRKDAKAWAIGRVVSMGAPRSWKEDEYDAFVVANWLCAELGATCIAHPEAA